MTDETKREIKTRRSGPDRKARLAEKNYWDDLMATRDEQRVQMRTGIQVVKEGDLPLEANRQGLMRWYMHPSIKDTALSTMIFYQQEIPPGSRSGRVKFQGGQVILILEGKGYTIIDGVKHSWEAGDVLNLPLRPRGIIVQHFNTDPNVAVKFVATEPNWTDCTFVDRGSGFEQLEDAPEYRR
ncbi:MAG: hypothetical protein IT536_17555 [Hyphomicrobiales bacterium]|nr:hypothetical protein [Hyphomicrobiales bacterium]